VGEFHRDRLMLIADGNRRDVLERAMAPVFAKRAELDAIEGDIQQRQEEVAAITRDQERVRQNMVVLKGSSSERQLLERYTRQLDAQETRLEQLRGELARLLERQERTHRELAELIMSVTVDVTM
jgi:predicted  nucleic acid-binding Zn-ribbon protein